MTRSRFLAVALVILAASTLVGTLSPVSAVASPAYCSPTGDYCIAVKRPSGRIVLRIGTFSFRRYTLCVTDPAGVRTCKPFGLKRTRAGLYESKVHWRAHFPDRGPGLYRVRWRVSGANIGRILRFRR